MELTTEIIKNALKSDLIQYCKERNLNYHKKTKKQLQDILYSQTTKLLNAKYEYVPDGDVELIIDRSTTPLSLKTEVKKVIEQKTKKGNKKAAKKVIKTEVKKDFTPNLDSNKMLYNNYLSLNRNFRMFYGGNLIFDSKINKAEILFEEEYFMINQQKYDYKKLKFKFS